MPEKTALETRLGPILRRLARRRSTRDDPAGAEAWTKVLLRSVRRYEPAEGLGPFPTAILLHGCGGDFRHLASWGTHLARHGILAFTIDSFTPRGLGALAARCLVCTGLRLQGQKRCRDITTILPIVLADPKVDPDRLSLLGWSHGGWTVAEWMLDPDAHAFSRRAGVSVRSVVLVYPYCGIASNVHQKPWTSRSPVLVVTCGEDRVVSNARTNAFIGRLSRAAVPVTHIPIEGVGHAFDVEGIPTFSPSEAADLRDDVITFLHRANG